jgi:hypothetical protein
MEENDEEEEVLGLERRAGVAARQPAAAAPRRVFDRLSRREGALGVLESHTCVYINALFYVCERLPRRHQPSPNLSRASERLFGSGGGGGGGSLAAVQDVGSSPPSPLSTFLLPKSRARGPPKPVQPLLSRSKRRPPRVCVRARQTLFLLKSSADKEEERQPSPPSRWSRRKRPRAMSLRTSTTARARTARTRSRSRRSRAGSRPQVREARRRRRGEERERDNPGRLLDIRLRAATPREALCRCPWAARGLSPRVWRPPSCALKRAPCAGSRSLELKSRRRGRAMRGARPLTRAHAPPPPCPIFARPPAVSSRPRPANGALDAQDAARPHRVVGGRAGQRARARGAAE